MSDFPNAGAGILCAGTILVDVGKVIDAYPALDHLATIEQVSLSTGGPALNMAVDLRLLGATFPIGVLGAVGDDEHAAFILAECARLGINTAGVRTLTGAVTSFTDGMIERDGGRRTFFHHSGANALFDASTADLQTSGARILHAGAPGIHPLMDSRRPDGGNGWSALLQRAQAAGLHTNLELVSLDPTRIAEVALGCLPYLDSIVINELEAGALTGIDAPVPTADGPVDWPVLEAMALRVIEHGVSVLAVVHFPAGCVAAAPGGRTWRQGSVRLPREQVRSTTGAGDAFAAGVILGLHEGWPVERCLRLGVASAAASVRSPNTSDGIKHAETCLAEADQAGYRPTPPVHQVY
jgi:sugar/nucleoside kinase (ribokinase family)